jgi:hypothetical protein
VEIRLHAEYVSKEEFTTPTARGTKPWLQINRTDPAKVR